MARFRVALCPYSVSARPPISVHILFRCFFLALLQVCASQLIFAADGVTRDPQAVAIIQKSVDAMGGAATFAGIQDCTVEGLMQVSPDSPFFSGQFVWKNAGKEFRYENPRADGVQILVSGHGTPAIQENGSVFPTSIQAGLATTPPYLMPRQLVDALQNPNIQISPISAGQVDGKPAIQVAIFDARSKLTASLTSQAWFFDSASALPLRVESRVASNSDANITIGAAAEFSDFRNESGIVIPFQLAMYQEDHLDSVLTLKSVKYNTGISPSEFDLAIGSGK